jgi:pimeloyl-ACP methyl ester carboxylesterase
MHRRKRAVQFLLAVFACAAPAAEVDGQTTFEGIAGEGSAYRIDVPAAWNGSLVLYAHGIVHPDAPVVLPNTQDDFNVLRDAVLARGFAVAYSSFSENGYAVKDAAQRTHQLKGLFSAHVGPPSRVYLVGHSLGAVAALKLAEMHPQHYSGALPMCGFDGGGQTEVDYLATARVLFDYFFPGAVPGDAFDVPPGIPFGISDPVFQRVFGSLMAGLRDGRTIEWARMARLAGVAQMNVSEIVTSGLSVIGYSVGYTNDLLERTHGHIPFDNQKTEYLGSSNDGALNLAVDRFASTPDALRYLDHNYHPTGALQIPTLTLRTARDPLIPMDHDEIFAGNVAANGASAFLVQRTVNRYGHCDMTQSETLEAFLALVAWVETGAVPAGGDVTR